VLLEVLLAGSDKLDGNELVAMMTVLAKVVKELDPDFTLGSRSER
jgi:hypothetical protein